jgi:hypothetical protein
MAAPASPAGRAANPSVELERTAYRIDVQDRRVRLITRQCTGAARDPRVKCWRDQIEGGVSVTEEKHAPNFCPAFARHPQEIGFDI